MCSDLLTLLRRSLCWLAGFGLCLCLAACGRDASNVAASDTPAREATGLSLIAGDIGGAGSADSTGTRAHFGATDGITLDSLGNLYVVDPDNQTIRKISPAGVVTTFAGMAGVIGSNDGTGAAAQFYYPGGVTVDGAGTVYVADSANHTIRKITPAGAVSTFAGTAGLAGSADGTGAAARFNFPRDITLDGAGNAYVTDSANHTIRKIDSAGVVTTLAGTAGSSGSVDGTGAAAKFTFPSGIAVDGAGTAYVADGGNHTIRKITPAGAVSTFAGTAGVDGSADGTGAAAQFGFVRGITLDGAGNVYVTDTVNHTIRKIDNAGVVSTLAGTAGNIGNADGTGAAAQFQYPSGIIADGSGSLYVADSYNYEIRKVTAAGVVSTVAGSTGNIGNADGAGAAARFASPVGVASDQSGNLYVTDTFNSTIRKIARNGVVTTLAGTAGNRGSNDGTGAAAQFEFPLGIAVDGSGNLYVADNFNHTIRKISPAGVVTTLAGTAGVAGNNDGTGAAARFRYPASVTVDGPGNVYVADTNNHTIRKISPAGVVTTLAGTAGSIGSNDGAGAAARFSFPNGLAADGAGNLYVADTDNHTIRKIDAAGVVSTLAGAPGIIGSSDGMGAAARFFYPLAVAADGSGNVYVADQINQTIRKITSAGEVTTVAGVTGQVGVLLGDLPGSLTFPSGVTVIAPDTLAVTTANGVVKLVLP